MKILVVEDDLRIAQAIKKGLTQERHVVDTAFTGTEGMDMAGSGDYDVVILDLMLPGKDGLSICKEMREVGNQTPVLILTAKGQIDDKVNGLDNKADDYLTKPFSFEELVARVKALGRRPREIKQTQLKVNDLELDQKAFSARRDKKEIALSSKEFALLEYLMRHADQIVTKEQITAHVWNFESDILPNTIEVYIKNLRRKIDEPYRNKPALIQTVRGFGYRLCSHPQE